MAYYLLINKVLVILITIFSLWLGFWVYFADQKSKLNRTFFLWVASTSLWIFLYYLVISSNNPPMAILWAKIGLGAVSLFYIPFYLFFVYFLHLEKKLRILTKAIFVIGITLFICSVFTNLVVKDVEFREVGADIILGKGSIAIYLVAVFLSILVITLLLKNYFKVPLQEKLKIQYFLVGIFIWVLMNFTVNMIPALLQGKNTPVAPLGNNSFIFLLAFTAYAIVKRELFGIRVVITTIFVSLIAILLALDILSFTTQPYLRILKGGALVIFLYLGYSMIRSVIREIEHRREIEKLSQAKSEFISIASHQLRTPLTAIKGYISMILEGSYGKLTGKTRRPMKNVYESNERLIKLVNDLLSLSRIESGKIQMFWEKTSIEDLVSSVIDVFIIEAEKKKIFLKLERPKRALPKILIDPDKIREVVSNIISNAIKYTEKGGITVRLKKLESKIQIIITDTGMGMEEDEISKVFESFSRGVAGTRLFTQGAGLGLYVSRRFVGMHDGKIWVESAGRNKGSTFYVELPMK